jgi:hypothetical protein
MALIHAELELLIVSGPMRGKQQTYVLADGRVPAAPERSREEDAAELARRYAQSHACATAQDFAWWSSLPVREAAAALEATELDVAGRPPDPPAALLLPTFDESVVAFRSGRYVLADGGTTEELLVRPVLAAGRVAGTWKRAGSRVEVELTAPAQADAEAVRAAAARLEAFA